MTFDQQADMFRLVAMMARMDIPGEGEIPDTGDDAVCRAIEDASALYTLIEDAREIMKSRNRRSKRS